LTISINVADKYILNKVTGWATDNYIKNTRTVNTGESGCSYDDVRKIKIDGVDMRIRISYQTQHFSVPSAQVHQRVDVFEAIINSEDLSHTDLCE
jgi:hypothetical protein